MGGNPEGVNTPSGCCNRKGYVRPQAARRQERCRCGGRRISWAVLLSSAVTRSTLNAKQEVLGCLSKQDDLLQV